MVFSEALSNHALCQLIALPAHPLTRSEAACGDVSR